MTFGSGGLHGALICASGGWLRELVSLVAPMGAGGSQTRGVTLG